MAQLTGNFYLAMLLIVVAIGLAVLFIYLLNRAKKNKFDVAEKKVASVPATPKMIGGQKKKLFGNKKLNQ